jgi:hypothetical protein
MKIVIISLFLCASLAAQIGGPARNETFATKDGTVYSVTWWAISCASNQRNDCEARVGEKTRIADVLVERDGKRIRYARRKCESDGCVKENTAAWVSLAEKESTEK